jgi:hypothetical protein
MTAVRLGTPSSLRLGAATVAGLAALAVIGLGVQLGLSIPGLASGRASVGGSGAPTAAVVESAPAVPALQIDQLLGAVTQAVATAPAPAIVDATSPKVQDSGGGVTPKSPKVDEPEPLVRLPELPIALPTIPGGVPASPLSVPGSGVTLPVPALSL